MTWRVNLFSFYLNQLSASELENGAAAGSMDRAASRIDEWVQRLGLMTIRDSRNRPLYVLVEDVETLAAVCLIAGNDYDWVDL